MMSIQKRIQLTGCFETLNNLKKPNQLIHQPLFLEHDKWIKFKICCYFQGINPIVALRNYMNVTSPDNIVEFAREYLEEVTR